MPRRLDLFLRYLVLSFAFYFYLQPDVGKAQSNRQELLRNWEVKKQQQNRIRERLEMEEVKPKVEEAIKSGGLDEITNVIDTIRYSRALRKETKEKLLKPLEIRQLVLLCGLAQSQINAALFDRARATIQKAEEEYTVMRKKQSSIPKSLSESLANAQYAYFIAIFNEIDQAIERDELDQADSTCHNIGVILSATYMPNEKLSDEIKRTFKAKQKRLRLAQAKRTIGRAKSAEQAENLRLARLLYIKAVKESDSPEAKLHLKRIEGYRRTPWLDFGLSAVVPGLGQFHSGRMLPAVSFFFSTALTVSTGIILAISAQDRYDDYQAATEPDKAEKLYDGINARWNIGMVLIGTGAALYIWNVLDAYFDSVNFNDENF